MIYIKEMMLNSTAQAMGRGTDEATIRLISDGSTEELFDFIMFFRDKGAISTETLTSYLIHRKLKESK